MADTFSFAENVLNLAKKFQAEGRIQKAFAMYQRILNWKNLPARIAEEAEGRLAELNLLQGRLAQARRHLSAALGYQPEHSHYHYLMGVAAESKDKRRALRHYHKSIKLHPNNPDYLCDFGSLAIECGYVNKGLSSLRRALTLAGDDANVIERVTQGMCKAGRLHEAKYVAQCALFRNRGDIKIRKIWEDVQFHMLSAKQQKKTFDEPIDAAPTLLRFRTDVAIKKAKQKRTWRFDGPAIRKGPNVHFRGNEPKPA